MEHLTAFAAEAIAAGGDGMKAIMHRYPDVPVEVAAEAECAARFAGVEGWWKKVEDQIETEIIARAITG